MNCTKCGQLIAGAAKFCARCGKPVLKPEHWFWKALFLFNILGELASIGILLTARSPKQAVIGAVLLVINAVAIVAYCNRAIAKDDKETTDLIG
jgi:hypothetical protein